MRQGLGAPVAYETGPAYTRYGTVPPYNGMQDPNYGAFAPQEKGLLFQNRGARKSNALEIILSVVLPWCVFAGVLSLISLSCHYVYATVVFVCTAIIGVFVLALGVVALNVFKKGGIYEAKWNIFIFFACIIAWILGLVCGQQNYVMNFVPFLNIENLNTYPNVDPTTTHGQLLMDAGRIEFIQGSQLDLSKSMGFRNVDFYCVAPVTQNASIQNQTMYDFWAVGVNCCSGRGDFHCGDFMNTQKMSGLRLMREDQRGYFRLAVQQAEAAYQIRAKHPIFLHWMHDPTFEIEAYRAAGYQYLCYGWLIFAIWSVVATTVAATFMAKFGL